MIAPTGSLIHLAQGGGFDWEALIPVVFILLYAISQIFGAGRKKGGKKKPTTAAPSSSPAERQQESEQESRARQIREEIQRKIAERREQTEAPAQRDLAEDRPRYDPSRSEHEQRRQPTTPSARRELSGGQRSPSAASRRELSPGGGQLAEGSVEAQLSEQRERLAAARREREAAQRKARDIVRRGQGVEGPRFAASHNYSWDLPDMSPARYRSDLIRLLSDPAGAQKAVLFREVLGPPVAYRDPTSPHERIP